jgi:ADP-ribose pyrophosphatase YjhB (NUDIX family)
MPHLHTHPGQYDYTVSGYLVHDDKTLLIKHKYLPIWTAPSGHVELNETPIDALFKEIEEEAGVHRSDLELIETNTATKTMARGEDNTYLPVPFDLEYHAIDSTHSHINMAYILKSSTNHVEPKVGESNTFKWFTIEELAKFGETRPAIINQAIYAINYVGKN